MCDLTIEKHEKQFYLYAKGWYQGSDDIWSDLWILYKNDYYGGDEPCKGFITSKARECAFKVILNNSKERSLDMLMKLTEVIDPDSFESRYYNESWDYQKRLLIECLSIMRFTKIANLDPDTDCNFDLLPENNNKD